MRRGLNAGRRTTKGKCPFFHLQSDRIHFVENKEQKIRCSKCPWVVSDDFIESAGIKNGTFDNISSAKYVIPSHWDISKVYKRLILGIAQEKEMDIIDALFAAYHSFVSDKIDDYNSSFYYDAPQNILNAFLYGVIE